MADETPEQEKIPEVPVEQNVTDKVLQIKMENDALEAELNRRTNLKAQLELGGRALAGKRDKTPEEMAQEEAKEKLRVFGIR